MGTIIDITYEMLPDPLTMELLEMENECINCCSKLEIAKSYIIDDRALELINEVIDALKITEKNFNETV